MSWQPSRTAVCTKLEILKVVMRKVCMHKY